MFGLTPIGDYLVSSLIQNILNGLFNNLVNQPIPQNIQISGNFINSEVRETPDSYILQIDLPGVTKEAINVKYIDNYLTLTANSDQYLKNGYGGYVRYIGNVNRSFYFEDIDGEKVDGSFENGVLKLILPKTKKQVEDK
ncbi:MAG: heat shock protein [Clostridiales bacterium]|jgi:HSP20 family protein|nr:heat shock protein [Clostridiales bacterium]